MAEHDGVARLITGRQAAHMEIIRRHPDDRPPAGERKTRKMPEVSVVKWQAHEEVCKPYRIKALISTSGPVSRKDILGQWAKFTFQTEEGAQVREFSGFISRFHSVSHSPDGYTYRVVMRQRLAMLDGPSNCATYQNRSSAEIVGEILERHDSRLWMRVEYRLRRQHPRHPFRFQYNMGDWAYCRLEMEQAGLFSFTETDKHGEVLVIADDIDGYTRSAIGLPQRPASGLLTFDESIYSLKVRTRTIPDSFIVADYNPENAAMIFHEKARACDEFSMEQHDGTTLGTPMVWGTHHEDTEGAKREATLRHEAARSQQVTTKAKSTMPVVRPGCVVKPEMLDADATGETDSYDSKDGVFVWKVVHRGARNQNYSNTFHAIPANRPYRMPIDESRRPRIHGTLGATVTSPDRYTFPYLTAKGEIVVRFHCDFGNWPKGAESMPLRMAKPFASRNRSGMNMPPVHGDEAGVAFREGNPNKPYVLMFMPNAVNEDLINSSRRRISRSEIRTRSGNKLWFDDWDNQRGIELSTEEAGRSQLNLGYIPDGELKERGRGAELRTGDHLVSRGGAGVMVTAYNQAGGSGKVLAMEETDAQFRDHQAMGQALAESASASKASPADTVAQQGISDGLHELKKPGVLVTGPGPMGIAAGDGMHLAADGSIIGTAKKGIHLSTLKRMTAAARGVMSFFSQQGMSLITSAGDFVAQAQRGGMQLASQGDMSVESVNGVVHVKASKEIILNVSGTYVKISGGGVEIGSRGSVLYRTAGVKGSGPAQMDLGGAAFAPAFVPYTTGCEVWRTNPAFVPPPAPAPAMAAAENAVAPAPNAVADALSRLASAQPETGSGTGSTAALTLTDSINEPAANTAPDPIKLAKAIPCDWKITDLKADIKQHMEASSYWGMLDDRTPWSDPKTGTQFRGGGSRDSRFEFAYSEQDKAITCTVRVMLVPMDLFPVDAQGNRDSAAIAQTIPYSSGDHWQMTAGSTVQGVKMDYRDAVGDTYDLIALRSRIEAVLNRGNYRLILDGCSKGAACGCRVKVNFRVDLRVSVKGVSIPGFNPHVSNHLFPSVLRADTSAWGEQYKYKGKRQIFDYPKSNVEAHECGHYFNFPDEYYDRGGWLHQSYIKDEHIDFSLVDAKAGTLTWQGRSDKNLMGYGANEALQPGRVTATIKPYYLEYVRRQFSLSTSKLWRVGYDA